MIRRPPRSTQSRSSASSDVYKRQHMTGKAANKEALQSKLGLNLEPDVPLLGVVSRFTEQKGLDLLLEIAPLLTKLPVQLAMLGSGDAQMQLSLIHISEPTRLGMISYAVF